MRPIGVTGSTRLGICTDRLPASVTRWREHWCFTDPKAAFSVSCQSEAAVLPDDLAGLSWLKSRHSAGDLQVAGAWREAVFGPHAASVPEDDTARHLLEHAQRALIDGLFAELGLNAGGPLEPSPPGVIGGLLGSRIVIDVQLNGIRLLALLDASLLDGFLPEVAAKPALIDRKSAVGGARFKLRVQMPLASLSIGDLRGLAPGDVLKAQAMLVDPVQLVVGQSDVIAQGYLARQQDQLAVQLINSDTGI